MKELVLTMVGLIVGFAFSLGAERFGRLNGFRRGIASQIAKLQIREKEGASAVGKLYSDTLEDVAVQMNAIREDISPWFRWEFDSACREYLSAGDVYSDEYKKQVISIMFPSADATETVKVAKPLAERMAASLSAAARSANLLPKI